MGVLGNLKVPATPLPKRAALAGDASSELNPKQTCGHREQITPREPAMQLAHQVSQWTGAGAERRLGTLAKLWCLKQLRPEAAKFPSLAVGKSNESMLARKFR